MSKIENPPAFPVKVRRNTSSDPFATPREFQLEGMSLRDWFAGRIAAGLASYSGTQGIAYGPGEIAQRSYEVADAMLAERLKGGAA